MKYITILFLIFFNKVYSQDTNTCEKIIISDSLFQVKCSSYNLSSANRDFTLYPKNRHIKAVQNINDLIVVENNCMKFRINYGCGCGTTEIKLVTDGVLLKDSNNNEYYIVKLYFVSNDTCKALCDKSLSYDISLLKAKKIKFYGYNEFLEVE